MLYYQNAGDLPANQYFSRCGVILYNRGYFGLFLDTKSGQLTDAGGSSMPYENPIQAALREFKEESLNIFPFINVEQVANQLVVHNNHNLILFLIIDENIDKINKAFLRRWNTCCNEKQHLENCAIVWLTPIQLQRVIECKTCYQATAVLLKDLDYIISFL
jgi:hypothetical protein